MQIESMSQKELAIQTIAGLPDDCTLEEIADKLRYFAAIREGMEQLDQGLEVDHEEVKMKLASWLSA